MYYGTIQLEDCALFPGSDCQALRNNVFPRSIFVDADVSCVAGDVFVDPDTWEASPPPLRFCAIGIISSGSVPSHL